MTLLIKDQLVNPPTWFSSFRDLTLYCSVFSHVEVVIECEDDNPDPYYHWLRPRGGMDFIKDFVPARCGERGIRLDVRRVRAFTVVTDRIVPENVHRLIAQIEAFKRWC